MAGFNITQSNIHLQQTLPTQGERFNLYFEFETGLSLSDYTVKIFNPNDESNPILSGLDITVEERSDGGLDLLFKSTATLAVTNDLLFIILLSRTTDEQDFESLSCKLNVGSKSLGITTQWAETIKVYQQGSVELPVPGKMTRHLYTGTGAPLVFDNFPGIRFYAGGDILGVLTLTLEQERVVIRFNMESTDVDDGSPALPPHLTYPIATWSTPAWNGVERLVQLTLTFNIPLPFEPEKHLTFSNCTLYLATLAIGDQFDQQLRNWTVVVSPINDNQPSLIRIGNDTLRYEDGSPYLPESITSFTAATLAQYTPRPPVEDPIQDPGGTIPDTGGTPPSEPAPKPGTSNPSEPSSPPSGGAEALNIRDTVPSSITNVSTRMITIYNGDGLKREAELISNTYTDSQSFSFDTINNNPVRIIVEGVSTSGTLKLFYAIEQPENAFAESGDPTALFVQIGSDITLGASNAAVGHLIEGPITALRVETSADTIEFKIRILRAVNHD